MPYPRPRAVTRQSRRWLDTIRADGRLDAFVKNRYRSWDTGIGKDIERGRANFKTLEKYTLSRGEPVNESGRQEFLENLINEFI